jgi:fluoride exporter
MSHLLLVGTGGFIGSVLRYWLSGVAQRWMQGDYPIGTLVVNAVGCLVIGAFWSLVEYREFFIPEWRIFMTVGVLGGFTTFSAFGYETFVLLRDGEYLSALINVAANVLIGLAAVAVGFVAAKAVV